MNLESIVGKLSPEETCELATLCLSACADGDAITIITEWAKSTGNTEELAAQLDPS